MPDVLKALPPIFSRFLPSEISLNLLFVKALSPMEITESGIVSFPVNLHPENAESSIVCTELPIVRVPVNAISFAKAEFPITVTLLGIFKSPASDLQPEKAPF